MLNMSRILFTLLCFGAFLIIMLITYRKGGKKDYDSFAEKIIDDDDTPKNGGFEKHDLGQTETHENGANK